jgi:hypothetical protein
MREDNMFFKKKIKEIALKNVLQKEWDKKLNWLIDNEKLIMQGDCSCVFYPSGIQVWTWNYPYSFGYPYNPKVEDLCPFENTKKRLKSLTLDVVKQRKEQEKQQALNQLLQLLGGKK